MGKEVGQGSSWRLTTDDRRLIDVGKIHAVGVLQAGDLPRMMLHFQVGLQNLDMHGFALRRGGAVEARIFQGQVAVMRLNELADHGVHSTADSALAVGSAESYKCLTYRGELGLVTLAGSDFQGADSPVQRRRKRRQLAQGAVRIVGV